MRFSDEQYLLDWKNKGRFPKIHDDIFQLIASTVEADSVMDICCSTGLLGQRVSEKIGIDVIGVEGHTPWIQRAKKFGNPLTIVELLIEPQTMDALVAVVAKHKITGIIARRCLSELFGNKGIGVSADKANFEFADVFSATLADAGVEEFWIEGRADQGRSTHPIPDTTTEIRCLQAGFEPAELYRNCAYLTKV